MSALELLKTVLDSPDAADVSEKDAELYSGDTKVSNFQKYAESPDPGVLLELLRSEASSSTNIPAHINNLSSDELFFLMGTFDEYKQDISLFKHKLDPIERLLLNFDQELSQLSSNLVSLHQQSTQLNSSLDTQKLLTEKLNPVILDLAVPSDISRSIISGDINTEWLENIRFLNEKSQLINNVESGSNNLNVSYKDSVAFLELKSGVEVLIAKAIERIRDFMISRIKLLRSSTTKSSQSIQQELIRVKDVFVFLRSHHPELALQLQLAYLYTMRWYYTSRFSKYLYALQKLHLRHVDSSLVLGSDGATEERGYLASGLKSWMSSQPAQQKTTKVTLLEYLGSVDKRMQILQNEKSNTAMPAQIAESTPFNYWIEFVFRQWFTALLDNVVVEYLFVVEFFFQGEEKVHSIDIGDEKKDWSLLIFENVYQIGQEFVVWLITHLPSIFLAANRASTTLNPSRVTNTFQGSCDAYAILLMIRVIQTAQIQLHNQFHIPVLEDHINSLLLTLWPQFTRIIDLNSESMKNTVIRVGGKNLAPTALTQQFGQMLSGLLKLSLVDVDGTRKIETLRGEPLYTCITRLRNDFESTLTKLSNQIKNKLDKEIFLFNNYFLVVNILKNENEVQNDFIQEQTDHFQKLCDAYR